MEVRRRPPKGRADGLDPFEGGHESRRRSRKRPPPEFSGLAEACGPAVQPLPPDWHGKLHRFPAGQGNGAESAPAAAGPGLVTSNHTDERHELSFWFPEKFKKFAASFRSAVGLIRRANGKA